MAITNEGIGRSLKQAAAPDGGPDDGDRFRLATMVGALVSAAMFGALFAQLKAVL